MTASSLGMLLHGCLTSLLHSSEPYPGATHIQAEYVFPSPGTNEAVLYRHATGQPDLDNSSLGFSSQVILCQVNSKN